MKETYKKQKNEHKAIDKSQKHYDYARIEELRKKVWADSEAQKNWEEFDRKRKAIK